MTLLVTIINKYLEPSLFILGTHVQQCPKLLYDGLRVRLQVRHNLHGQAAHVADTHVNTQKWSYTQPCIKNVYLKGIAQQMHLIFNLVAIIFVVAKMCYIYCYNEMLYGFFVTFKNNNHFSQIETFFSQIGTFMFYLKNVVAKVICFWIFSKIIYD